MLASKFLCSHAAMPPSLHLLFLATSCFSTTRLFTALPLLLFTLPQRSFSPSSVIQGVESGGGGSLLWSDSYKTLISTRNMIARETGGWNVENGRNWEKNIPWIKALSHRCLFPASSVPDLVFLFLNPLPFFCFTCFLPPLPSSDLLRKWITDANSPAHKLLAWMLSLIMDGCSRTISMFDLRYVINMHWG